MFKIHEIENSLTGRDFTNIVAVKERIFVDPEIKSRHAEIHFPDIP